MLKNIHHKDFDCEDEESILDLEKQMEVMEKKRRKAIKLSAKDIKENNDKNGEGYDN